MVPTAAAPVASSSRAAPAAARARVPTGSSRTVSSAAAATNAQLEMMQEQLVEIQASAEGFEKERDFYFESRSTFLVHTTQLSAPMDKSGVKDMS